METKSLLYGITGFILGGLLVSIAATTFNKPQENKVASYATNMTMADMTSDLNGKTGDNYDKAFIAEMIEHHEGAVEMAKLSMNNAKHEEIKKLSGDIIIAQEKEISTMKQWQIDWGYVSSDMTNNMHNSMH
jgi:uncharacterized protein (DUF305 family)